MADICYPLTQKAAQARYLRRLGLTVERRPDGSPLVLRSHYEAVRGGQAGPSTAGPAWKVRP